MVIALFVMIFCMVIDRVLYSSTAFNSRKALSSKLDTNSPILTNETTSDIKSSNSGPKLKYSRQTLISQSDFQTDSDMNEMNEHD
jgi:hypothetical protein